MSPEVHSSQRTLGISTLNDKAKRHWEVQSLHGSESAPHPHPLHSRVELGLGQRRTVVGDHKRGRDAGTGKMNTE